MALCGVGVAMAPLAQGIRHCNMCYPWPVQQSVPMNDAVGIHQKDFSKSCW